MKTEIIMAKIRTAKEKKKENLDLSEMDITNADVETLMKEIKGAGLTLKSLNLDNNCLDDDGAITLSNDLPHFGQLTELSLQDNMIDENGMIALFDCIRAYQLPLNLLLHGNKVTDTGRVDEMQRTIPQLR